MILDLNENEVGALVSLMDIALKICGLQAKPAVDIIWSKLEAAKTEETKEKENFEQDKKCTDSNPM